MLLIGNVAQNLRFCGFIVINYMPHNLVVGRETRNYFKKIGLPESDCFDLPTSAKRFPDDCQYRIELPGVETPEIMAQMIELAERRKLKWHRFVQTTGIFRLTDSDIERMVEMCKQSMVELTMAVGPRSVYDTGAAVRTPAGGSVAYKLRGMEQLVRAIEDVKRATSLGVRGILLVDEGLLWILKRMRDDEIIPRSTTIKVSSSAAAANPASVKILEDLGADSVNPVSDLDLPMLGALRRAVNIPLDIHSDTTQVSGGFIRTYEVPEFIRIGSPVYLKIGAVATPAHNHFYSNDDLLIYFKQVEMVLHTIRKYYPKSKISKMGAADIRIPR